MGVKTGYNNPESDPWPDIRHLFLRYFFHSLRFSLFIIEVHRVAILIVLQNHRG